jgi:transketolase
MNSTSVPALHNIAARLRIDSILSTTASASGHPTTCMSAAEIVATLFFSEMRLDPHDPQNPHSDRFVLSKGHAAPILYAAWAEAGLFPRSELLKLRQIGSDLEGHPTPRLSFVDVATGSLGQGICAAVGSALNARRIGSDYRTYALIGDGEMAEGSVWESANAGINHRLDNLCVIVDVNALGQSQATQFGHDTAAIAKRWTAFGWQTIEVDGHDVQQLLNAYDQARQTKGRPTAIVARTLKGKGVSFVEGKEGWHGKAFKKDEADKAVAEIEKQMIADAAAPEIRRPESSGHPPAAPADYSKMPPPAYKLGDSVATREAWGTALAALGGVDPRVVALDADVKNSTFSDRFEKAHPERFYEFFIAEQAMIGAAMGLAARGAIPFPSTFACFLTRASDFIRMAGISRSNVKLAGSHAGVSIGEDGPSQMALEDLALMRSVRPKTPVIYGPDEKFPIGGSKVLRQSDNDVAAVITAGVTVFETLKAFDQLQKEGIAIRVIDAYSVQPIDAQTMIDAAKASGGAVITVEDHYAAGGIGDAVSEAIAPAGFAVRRLAVREIPRSGQPGELLDRYGISAAHIVDAVRAARRR